MSVLCLDIGSTWTKAALVAFDGTLLGTAAHPTTPPEVLTGITAVTAELNVPSAEMLACSSAGGGLRLAVVGQERLISAEAAYRVALSAGAKVVHVSAGELDGAGVRALRATRPDVILLAGGTDGGDTRVLLHNAHRLAANRIATPIVLAGNHAVRDDACSILRATGRTVVVTDNVLPDVGELAPGPARAAIRAVFLAHVIGGKGLSRGPRFHRLVRAVTPDVVLVGVSRLAALAANGNTGASGAVLVVDVGGATTDVYSAAPVSDARAEHAVGLPEDRRTVEGDIGMRSSAPGVVIEADAEGLLADGERSWLAAAAQRLADRVDVVPNTTDDRRVDNRLAVLAAVLGVRRHLRLIEGAIGPRGAGLLVFSGGVFRHATVDQRAHIAQALRSDPMLRPLLRHARVVVDQRHVLAPAGLLAEAGRPADADVLLRTELIEQDHHTPGTSRAVRVM